MEKNTEEKTVIYIKNLSESRPPSLEEIVKEYREKLETTKPKITYPRQFISKQKNTLLSKLTKETETNANVVYVPSSELPSGDGWRALGMYVPSTHTIYIANDLSEKDAEFVYHHEIAHAKGVVNKELADLYAFQKTGYMLAS